MRKQKWYQLIAVLMVALTLLSGCQEMSGELKHQATNIAKRELRQALRQQQRKLASQASATLASSGEATQSEAKTSVADNHLADLKMQKRQIVSVNQNQPDFSKTTLSLSRGSWQQYSQLDHLNRVQVADAMLGRDLMPTEKRQRLTVRPTGWHNKKVRMGDHQDWLYNRCHLIGYQLTGQNDNPKNLMTGTRSLNDPGMTYYENAIAQYIKQTGHHVRYQVKPIFKGDELVARGVQMQGQSIEDSKIKFNIYLFNVQSGYTINYTDGTSHKS